MAGLTLELVVDLEGTAPEDRDFAPDFSNFVELAAGATIVSAVYKFQAPGGPVYTAPATAAGLTIGAPRVVGAQVQVEIVGSLAAVGVDFAVSCTATLSTGRKIIRRGRLLVLGSQ